MQYTTHYNLKKPDLTDLVDVADINFNSDTLDTAVYGKEDTSNKVTSISTSSTDAQYPSAKCVYDLIGDCQTAIDTLNSYISLELTAVIGGSY